MSERVERSVEVLRSLGIDLDSGLSELELVTVERTYGFEFSPDHREFLSLVQPLGKGWWNWRTDSAETLRERLEWPIDGVLFDVENNGFWPEEWGAIPADLTQARTVARSHIERWPKLVPLWGHRFMPAAPAGVGAPVFSVWQTDVIFYGDDLLDYVHHEFSPGDGWSSKGSDFDVDTLRPWTIFAMG
jgi:hypothetical protein